MDVIYRINTQNVMYGFGFKYILLCIIFFAYKSVSRKTAVKKKIYFYFLFFFFIISIPELNVCMFVGNAAIKVHCSSLSRFNLLQSCIYESKPVLSIIQAYLSTV